MSETSVAQTVRRIDFRKVVIAALPLIIAVGAALLVFGLATFLPFFNPKNWRGVTTSTTYMYVLLYIGIPLSALVTLSAAVVFLVDTYKRIRDGLENRVATTVNIVFWLNIAVIFAFLCLFVLEAVRTDVATTGLLEMYVWFSPYMYLIVFAAFLWADWQLMQSARRKLRTLEDAWTGEKSAKGPVDQARRNSNTAILYVWVIDIPVLLTALIVLAIENLVLQSNALSGLTVDTVTRFEAAGVPPPSNEMLQHVIADAFADGFTSGALIMHVLMSQVVFVVLNVLHALKREGD
jgi:hypothetical protein